MKRNGSAVGLDQRPAESSNFRRAPSKAISTSKSADVKPPATTENLCRRLLWVIALHVFAVAPQAISQSGGVYDLTWHTNDGGGITFANGGAYQLGGTIGQHDAGASSGGAYSLTSGYWGVTNGIPSPTPTATPTATPPNPTPTPTPTPSPVELLLQHLLCYAY